MRIPEDKSLRLLIEITEEMDDRELYAAYERREAAGEATAKQLFQLVIFGFMNGYYSLREMRDACRYDLRMIYLLRGKRVSSHERFGDFIRHRLAGVFYQLVTKLLQRGCLSFANLFVDETRIEVSAIKTWTMGVSQVLCKLKMLALKENGMRRRAGLPVRCLVCLGTEILRAVKGDGVSRRSYTLDDQRISVTPACDLRNIR